MEITLDMLSSTLYTLVGLMWPARVGWKQASKGGKGHLGDCRKG